MIAEKQIHPEISVAEVMARWPETAAVFLMHRTACIGCELASFDNLADAARNYQLPVEKLLHDLEKSIQKSEAQLKRQEQSKCDPSGRDTR
jgi:hybrid cluster-associated redox disulfide protein